MDKIKAPVCYLKRMVYDKIVDIIQSKEPYAILGLVAVCILCLAIFLLCIRFLRRVGILRLVKVEEVITEECFFVYRSFKQSYMKSGEGISDIEKELEEVGITSRRSFGVYYDNPKFVPKDECRSVLGVILESTDDFDKLPENSDLSFSKFEEGTRLTVEWPFYGVMSIMVGAMRVYPKIFKQMEKLGYDEGAPCMELYDWEARKLWYISPVDEDIDLYDGEEVLDRELGEEDVGDDGEEDDGEEEKVKEE